MNPPELMAATIASLGRLIRAHKLSPVELTKAVIDRTEAVDPLLKAFTTFAPDYALDRARLAEAEIMAGRYRGPLHGISYTLKDVIATRGIRTTWGHPRLVDFKPTASATVHTRLEDLGAVLLGKVYSHIGRGDNPVMCFSPWDPTTSPGTSSSGSGAAVASGMGIFSVGTDTGGSVRHPSSNCGLVGMKATFGRISRHGVWASTWSTDQAGPIAKTAEDVAILMEALTGYDGNDLVSLNVSPLDVLASFDSNPDALKGLRIGVPRDSWVWKDWIDQDEEDAVRTGIGVLQGMGMEVREVSLPLAVQARAFNLVAEVAVYLRDNFSQEVLDAWPEWHAQLERGARQTVADYLHAQQLRAAIRQEIIAALTTVDFIAMPTGSTIGDKFDATTAVIRGRTVPARSRSGYLNGVASLTGVPAMSLPCGFAKGGRFPVGLQLIGRDLDEGLLLRVAQGYQTATDWHTVHPSL